MTSVKSKTALAVNLNKVALVRNSRYLGIPSVTRAATLCLEAGASGITVHPRPDGRHVRSDDVHELRSLLRSWPQIEYTIEGNPFHNLMDLVRELRPHQCTLVPDTVPQFTSDHGWNLPVDGPRLAPAIAELRSLGVRVALFMDPLPKAMVHAKAIGADRVELYTESYARAWGTPRQAEVLDAFVQTACAAQAAGMDVNAGHDLSRENLTEFLQAVPGVREVSIGHALISDALELGYKAAVEGYLAAIDRAFHGRTSE